MFGACPYQRSKDQDQPISNQNQFKNKTDIKKQKSLVIKNVYFSKKIELFKMLISNLAPRFWREFWGLSLLESFRRAYIESRA